MPKTPSKASDMFQTSPYFVAVLKDRGLYSDELLEEIQATGGSIQNMDSMPADLKKTFVIAARY